MTPPSRIRRCQLYRFGFALLLLIASALTDAIAAGRICTSADTFSFGNRPVGSSTTATATVSNCGDAPWSFTDTSVDPATGPAFSISSTCMTGLTLAPGATCAVIVRFAPAAPGQTSGGYWLRNTTTADPNELITFYGRGIDADSGTATLQFIPASASFPAQVVGTLSAPLDIKLHNLGPAALTLTASILNGPAAHYFSGYGTCALNAAIAAGDSCDMFLVFDPQATGTRLANLVIDSPQLSSLAILQISGIGTSSPPAPPAPTTVDVVEFYNASLDHYFMTALQNEITALDSGTIAGWSRTGYGFNAYPQATAGASPVCRFYMPVQNSHFYSASPAECAEVTATYPSFILESSEVFYIPVPDAAGNCASGTVPVTRFFNNRTDANHRYVTDPQIKAQMIAKGYTAEGSGPDVAIMCAPQ